MIEGISIMVQTFEKSIYNISLIKIKTYIHVLKFVCLFCNLILKENYIS